MSQKRPRDSLRGGNNAEHTSMHSEGGGRAHMLRNLAVSGH